MQKAQYDSSGVQPVSVMTTKKNLRTATSSSLYPQPEEDEDPSECSTIASHLEVASAANSVRSRRTLPQDALPTPSPYNNNNSSSSSSSSSSNENNNNNNNNNNNQKQFREKPMERKLGLGPVIEAQTWKLDKELFQPSNLSTSGTSLRNNKLVKTSSLRLPQRIDKFHTFDAACDVQPSKPRQSQRQRRRNSFHGSAPDIPSTLEPQRPCRRTRRASMGEVRSSTSPLNGCSQTMWDHFQSAQGAWPRPKPSRNHEQSDTTPVSPAQSRWNSEITSTTGASSRCRRNSLGGSTNTQENDIAMHSASSKTVDQAMKHPRQRRNSISGPIETTNPKTSRRNPLACSPKRGSPRTTPPTGRRQRFQRAASCTNVGVSTQQTGLPPAPILLDSNDPVATSPPTSKRRSLFQRGFSCSTFLRSPKTSSPKTTPPSTPPNMRRFLKAFSVGTKTNTIPCTPPNRRSLFGRGLSCNNIERSPPNNRAGHLIPSTPPTTRSIAERDCFSVNSLELSPKDLHNMKGSLDRVEEHSSSHIAMALASNDQSPQHTRRSSFLRGDGSPRQCPKSKVASPPNTPKISPLPKESKLQRRASCGTYSPPSSGSNCMLDYSTHTVPKTVQNLPDTSDQTSAYRRRRRRNSLNGPLSTRNETVFPVMHGHLPTYIPEEYTEALSSSSKLGNGTSPSSSNPLDGNITSLSSSSAEAGPPPRTLRGFRENSCSSLIDSVNEVIQPLEASSRFSAGSFDVGPIHPRQRNFGRRASLGGPISNLLTPRTPITPITPASTMASTISSRSRSRPGLHRRASCGSLTIRSLSPHIDLVSPLSFFEEKLAVQDPARFASGCGDKAPPAPPQRHPPSKWSVAGSSSSASPKTNPEAVSASTPPRPKRSRRASSGSSGYSNRMNHAESISVERAPSAVEAAVAMQEPTAHSQLPPISRGLNRRASCSALGYSASTANQAPARVLPCGTSSSALRLAQAKSSSSRGSEALRASATDEAPAAAAVTAKPSAPQARVLPRNTSSSAFRAAEQVDFLSTIVDAPPRQPRRMSAGSSISPDTIANAPSPRRPNSPRQNRRASCSACTHEIYVSNDTRSPRSAGCPSYWVPTKASTESFFFPNAGRQEPLPTPLYISPDN